MTLPIKTPLLHPSPPPIIPFALYQTYPSNALVQVFTETQRIPKNYFEGSSIVGEESSSEMEENGAESANTFAASLLICAVSTQNRQLPNLQCTHLSCEQFLLSHSRSRARARGEQQRREERGQSPNEEKNYSNE